MQKAKKQQIGRFGFPGLSSEIQWRPCASRISVNKELTNIEENLMTDKISRGLAVIMYKKWEQMNYGKS